jgi:hypothetical protein
MTTAGRANAEIMGDAGLNDHDRDGAIVDRNVDLCSGPHEDRAIEVPSGRDGGIDADEAVIALHDCFLESIG